MTYLSEVVGVVGVGTMGAGIAQLALEAGHPVWIHDVDAAAIERGRARIKGGLERRAGRLDLDLDSAAVWVAARYAALHDSATLDDLASAGPLLVVEAALEDLEAKRSIFQALDANTPPTAILATNTSALPVASIAAATRHPGRVVGLHFFNPAQVMPLVEVIATTVADPSVLDRATALVTTWGKVPVRCRDTPGFIVNRVNRPFTLEALAILGAGRGSVEGIDEAMRSEGFPMGPFELMDLVGLDINLAAARGVFAGSVEAGDPSADRFRPSPIQERLVADGRLGRKTGEGFYRYDDGGRRIGPAGDFAAAHGAGDPGDHGDPGDPGDHGDHGDRLDDVAIADRITIAIVNEAYRAASEGVATPADIDLAMRLGASHPSGPFERGTALGGPAAVFARLRAFASEGPRFDPAPSLVDPA